MPFTYIRETSTDGKSLNLYIIVWSLGLRVFGITSSDARIHVTIKFVSSQTHFSGHIPNTEGIIILLPININKTIIWLLSTESVELAKAHFLRFSPSALPLLFQSIFIRYFCYLKTSFSMHSEHNKSLAALLGDRIGLLKTIWLEWTSRLLYYFWFK